MEEIISKEEKSKVWIGKDGILNIVINMKNPVEDILDFLEEVKKVLSALGDRVKILVDISGSVLGHMRSSQLRNRAARHIRGWLEKVKFEKVAIFGGDVVRRTITSFLVTATGLKNIKVFETKEDALKWLKKP